MENRPPMPPHPEEPWDLWHEHHHHHYPLPLHRCAPECDDQLAVFSGVGRGLRGDSYKVELKYNENGEMYLEGMQYDAATNTWTTDWISGVIDGGKLTYEYNLNEHTNPQTFTITFRYTYTGHPEREWVWTTPAIPYFAEPSEGDVGFTDLAKILGLTEEDLHNILDDVPDVIIGDGFTGDNIKDYIDNKPTGMLEEDVEKALDDLSDHIHEDMGFGTILVNDGDTDTKSPKRNTIKKWFDWLIGQLGFGDDVDEFGGGVITNLKQYIDSKESRTINTVINMVANPQLYSKKYDSNIWLVFYDISGYNGSTVGQLLISDLVSTQTPVAALEAEVVINYFDVLPLVDFAITPKAIANNGFSMTDKIIAVICTKSGNVYTPKDFAGETLDHRNFPLKTPLINPEVLSNTGTIHNNADSQQSKLWNIYTGVGNCVCKTAGTAYWPWGISQNAYAYIFHRTSDYPAFPVMIDYGRTYRCSYNQATDTSS